MRMRQNSVFIYLLLAVALVPFLSTAGHGAEDLDPLSAEKQAAAANAPLTEAAIKEKIALLQAKVKVFQDAENDKVAQSLGVSLAQLKERTAKAQESLAFYNRQLMALKRAEELASKKKALEEAVASGEAFELPQLPPYSLQIYDETIAQLNERTSARETAQLSLALRDKMVKRARQHLKEVEQQLRELKVETAAGKENGARRARQEKIGLGQVELELARARLGYEELAYKNAGTELAIAEIKVSVAEQRVSHLQGNLHFDAEDLESQLANIEEKKAELQGAADDLLKKLQQTEARLLAAQKRLEEAGDEGEEYAEAKAEVAALQAWRQTCQRGLEQYESSLQLCNYQKEVWKQRYALIRGDAATADLHLWRQTAEFQKERIQQALALEQSQLVNLHLQISQVEKQLARDGLSWGMKGNLKEQLEALKELADSSRAYLITLSITSQMSSRFIHEVDAELAENVFFDKMAVLASQVQAAWKFELLVLDDQAVTVGKVAIALFLLVFGIILAGHVTRAFQRYVLARTRLSESASAITEKLLYYTTLCVVVLISMRVVSIPLTAFAFLGGALAIGVGFGGQKIIGNFISGFILMAEQPVKVGDLIQMEEVVGKIEEIGARATRVRSFANIHVLVPNSYFLENNIVNWTHNDKIIRGEVQVGVAYGSSTTEVRKALMQATLEHAEILDHPKPYVFLNDFGDNSLVFTLYFWIQVQIINDRKRIESDLRFIIDDLFREAGIVIAFPQRDVHLDISTPLKVEMVTAGQEGAKAGDGSLEEDDRMPGEISAAEAEGQESESPEAKDS
ncbi:MAG: mechanosensitive ion channel [Desulfurivibrionaceae bacterium]|nr:mechanosensitive ion channel [Desulfurivibrionaceae bacterium]